jgi:hypothetical protein
MPKKTCPTTPGHPIGMASTSPQLMRDGDRPYLESPHAAVRELAVPSAGRLPFSAASELVAVVLRDAVEAGLLGSPREPGQPSRSRSMT